MPVETIIGDTAYSSKNNLEYTKTEEIQLIAKLHPMVTYGNVQRKNVFNFNKDAGMFACPHETSCYS